MTKKKKILLSILAIIGLLIGEFIAFLFYSEYSTVYFGYEGDQFVERIGGPYLIPLLAMLAMGVLFVAAFIYLFVQIFKKEK
ncbi:MAG: hypothetical protein IKF80_04675 [Erysipelotrichaceae bacterium]|nr:hypothetical protein [Erysipelotrichaceae bacterium]